MIINITYLDSSRYLNIAIVGIECVIIHLYMSGSPDAKRNLYLNIGTISEIKPAITICSDRQIHDVCGIFSSKQRTIFDIGRTLSSNNCPIGVAVVWLHYTHANTCTHVKCIMTWHPPARHTHYRMGMYRPSMCKCFVTFMTM